MSIYAFLKSHQALDEFQRLMKIFPESYVNFYSEYLVFYPLTVRVAGKGSVEFYGNDRFRIDRLKTRMDFALAAISSFSRRAAVPDPDVTMKCKHTGEAIDARLANEVAERACEIMRKRLGDYLGHQISLREAVYIYDKFGFGTNESSCRDWIIQNCDRRFIDKNWDPIR